MNELRQKYSREELDDICSEIEKQWEYQLLVRAVFHSRVFESTPKYESPKYYQKQEIHFIIKISDPLPDIMKRGLRGVGGWSNQNYVIRLYGILDQHQIIEQGISQGNVYIKILKLLRNSVGAHTRGYRKPGKRKHRKVTELIQEYLDSAILPEDIDRFNLSIDTVLEVLKNRCKDFVLSLEGQVKP